MDPRECSSHITCLDLESINLPNSNKHFRSRFKLLRSNTELNTFHHLFLSVHFLEPNLLYQSWFIVKWGLEPIVELEALEQVLMSCTPKKIAKSLKRGGPKQPDGPQRYVKLYLMLSNDINTYILRYWRSE